MHHHYNNGGISHFVIDYLCIHVTFKSGKTYTYTDDHSGEHHVSNMIDLGIDGAGLSRYIRNNKVRHKTMRP